MPLATCAAWRAPPPAAPRLGTVRTDGSSWWDLPADAGRTAAPPASPRASGSRPRGRSRAPPALAPADACPAPPPLPLPVLRAVAPQTVRAVNQGGWP